MKLRPNIKICGLTQLSDAKLAESLGAWALGFIFHEKSPRFILPIDAGKIIAGLNSGTRRVGVFVDPSSGFLARAIEESGITAIQLHGHESPQFCESVKNDFPQLQLIKALRLRSRDELPQVSTYAAICDLILLDTFAGEVLGGSGIPGNWSLAHEAGELTPVLLAGGITPENVAQALRVATPYGIDVASGVETNPGIKSAEKLAQLFEKAGQL